MSLAMSNLSPIGTLLIAAFVTCAVISLSVIFLWWIKNVLRHRLPKPFLGEGPNLEWAELKRAELKATTIEPEDLSTTLKDLGSSVSSSGIPQADTYGLQFGRNGGDSPHLTLEHSIDDDSLLQAWLAETGHIDDEWAEKLLGKKGSTEET
ncbi:MAG: hypothetical protein IIA89_15480 [Chloroflexi bacterium]|nr:hypothetical protein [Chloroflexota bacterium]